MAKKLKDCFLEWQEYPHSKEYFELTKSIEELKLLEQFIEAQEFLREHKEELESKYNFTEGYFAECLSQDELDSLYVEAGENGEEGLGKLKMAFNKIWLALKKVLEIFIMKNSSQDMIEKRNKIIESIRKRGAISSEVATKIKAALNRAWKDEYNSEFKFLPPADGESVFSSVTGIDDDFGNGVSLRTMLESALNINAVYADVMQDSRLKNATSLLVLVDIIRDDDIDAKDAIDQNKYNAMLSNLGKHIKFDCSAAGIQKFNNAKNTLDRLITTNQNKLAKTVSSTFKPSFTQNLDTVDRLGIKKGKDKQNLQLIEDWASRNKGSKAGASFLNELNGTLIPTLKEQIALKSRIHECRRVCEQYIIGPINELLGLIGKGTDYRNSKSSSAISTAVSKVNTIFSDVQKAMQTQLRPILFREKNWKVTKLIAKFSLPKFPDVEDFEKSSYRSMSLQYEAMTKSLTARKFVRNIPGVKLFTNSDWGAIVANKHRIEEFLKAVNGACQKYKELFDTNESALEKQYIEINKRINGLMKADKEHKFASDQNRIETSNRQKEAEKQDLIGQLRSTQALINQAAQAGNKKAAEEPKRQFDKIIVKLKALGVSQEEINKITTNVKDDISDVGDVTGSASSSSNDIEKYKEMYANIQRIAAATAQLHTNIENYRSNCLKPLSVVFPSLNGSNNP